jgi:hypothetical protein
MKLFVLLIPLDQLQIVIGFQFGGFCRGQVVVGGRGRSRLGRAELLALLRMGLVSMESTITCV